MYPDKLDDTLKTFHRDAHAKFGVERIVTARISDLMVCEVSAPFEVRENDGAERVVDVSHRRTIPMGAVVL